MPKVFHLLFVGCLVASNIVRAQSSRDSLIIRAGRVGDLVAGTSIDSLYLQFPRPRTRLVDRRGEGLFDPVIEIRRATSDKLPSLIVEVASSRCGHRVGRITVVDARFRTESGLHVGSTLDAVRRQLPISLSHEEGLHAISASPALTFDLADDSPTAIVTAITVFPPVKNPNGCAF